MEKNKFVILTNPRTGSEYLIRLLDQHSMVHCLGEVFSIGPDGKCWIHSEFKKNHDPFGYLNYEYEQTDKTIVGYKQMSSYLTFMTVDELIKQSKEQNYKFILLTRNDMLRQYTSFQIMIEQGYGHIQGKAGGQRTIHLNPEIAYMTIRKWRGFEKNCIKSFEKYEVFDYLHLIYEQDFGENKLVKQKVFQFLDIPYQEIGDPLSRTNSGSLKDIITNYDEVIEYFKSRDLICHKEGKDIE